MRPKSKLQEYEVNLDYWNVLTKKHENRYDFFMAESEEQATTMTRWKYGTTTDIISVKLSD
jgi:hypothetical protein